MLTPRESSDAARDAVRLADLLADWTDWQTAVARSPHTIRHRLDSLERFQRLAGIDLLVADWRSISRFLARIDNISTRRNYHAILKAWFTWLRDVAEERDDNPMSKIPLPKMPTRRPKPVEEHELARILATGMYTKTRTMILLGFLQGMRVSEIASMHGSMINRRTRTMRIIGKGSRERVITVHPAIMAAADQYPADGWWFPSRERPGEPYRGVSVTSAVGRVFRRAGVASGGAHRLRHYYGTHTLDECGNIRVVAELLGHADLNTTAGYTLVYESQMREAVDALKVPLHVPRSRGPAAARKAITRDPQGPRPASETAAPLSRRA